MFRTLFWNLHQRRLDEPLRMIVRDKMPDVVIVCESAYGEDELAALLSQSSGRIYVPVKPLAVVRVQMFTVFCDDGLVVPLTDKPYFCVVQLNPPIGDSIILAAAHLISKHKSTERDLSDEAANLREAIEEAEERVGHMRSILIGDLNMSPFEAPVVGASGLHAIMDRRIARTGRRVVRGRERKMFYNPMWELMARWTGADQPLGTYFYNNSQELNYYWHTFDQVLIRPALIAGYDPSQISILTEWASGRRLCLQNGQPNKRGLSDHLPLLYKVNN